MATGPFALFKWQALFGSFDTFLQGFLHTIAISLVGLIFAILIGVVFGMMSASRNMILKTISRIYVEVIQNTPLVLQIFFYYNGLPYLDIILPLFTIGVMGLSIYHGAYIAEVVRAGILAIDKGQQEAGHSQGFTNIQIMIYIILPQAVRMMLPPLTNQCVNLIKNTSVLAMIAGGDLMYQANSWASYTLYYGPSYVVTALLYFILCFPLTRLAIKLERRSKEPYAFKNTIPPKVGEAV